MADIMSFLPPFEGWLPKWLLLVSIISIGNSIQAYTTLTYTARLYNPNPNNALPPSNISAYMPASLCAPASKDKSEIPSQVTPLSARKFGTWTLLTSIVRLYVAFHINEPAFYQLGAATYIVAFVHFFSEWRVFGTTRWGVPLAGPVAVSTASLAWMWMQKDFYLGQ
ncbi:ergosterol biosynthesis protein [Lentithecium fluviatile CBS 122367]|uniref:Ergosterol biosynthesis protein n=1 Tax=Lentithecium fluviatile CBS 122367 TaxID=1168545 RepID=A0A6G1J265_9PLEO|nr:ergosterol biosynthesis protein [Lentithecium fluviatile CBS 122367]